MTDTDSFLIEVHPRNQSRMNNVWSFTSMNHVVRKEIIWYYYGATSVKKLHNPILLEPPKNRIP